MRYIRLEDNKIVGVRFGPSIVDGEITSDIGEVGQILQPDGTFATPPPPPPGPDPDEELLKAIEASTDVTTLKAALLGNGKLARVKGRAK